MAASLVEMDHVTKTFVREQSEVRVLQDLELTISPGEFHAFMGPSGSGKSTLLNLIAGLDRSTTGAVRVEGQDLSQFGESELAQWRAEHVGFIFQLYNLIPVLTAFENVELPLLLVDMPRGERRDHVARALDLVGLKDRMDHFPRQLSGGQEQRVAIARALVTDPALILADEPTGDLDANSAAEVLDLLARLHREQQKTILMVTHDARAAARAATIHYLDKGKLWRDLPRAVAALVDEARK